MSALQESMLDFRNHLQKGSIQVAYKGLLDYIQSLRHHFAKTHPEFSVSGMPYFGYMDMTYFSVVPENLKKRGLKIAIVFVYETFRFEVWLAAVNKKIQTDFWHQIKGSGWNKYQIVPSTQGYDSIVEMNLVETPDFDDLPGLTRQIEAGTLQFIADVEAFLLST